MDRPTADAHCKHFMNSFLKGYSPEKPYDIDHVIEGARFRVGLITAAFEMIVTEGHQENFKPIYDMFHGALATDHFEFAFLKE